MNPARLTLAALLTLTAATVTLASDAESSASAGSNTGSRNGTAQATAGYDGLIGFAHTDTESGDVNVARGVAVGFDENGLSLSVSNAIAGQLGLGLATNFNLSIDRNGNVAHSGGVALAESPVSRSVTAGGSTSTNSALPNATSMAGGKTDPYGRVDARTYSDSSTSRAPARIAPRSPAPAPRPAPVVIGKSSTVRHTVSTSSRSVRVVRVRHR